MAARCESRSLSFAGLTILVIALLLYNYRTASDNEEDQPLLGRRRGFIAPRLRVSFLPPSIAPRLRLARGEANAWPGTCLQLSDCLCLRLGRKDEGAG